MDGNKATKVLQIECQNVRSLYLQPNLGLILVPVVVSSLHEATVSQIGIRGRCGNSTRRVIVGSK